jgi:predicted RNA polymerase sigma factor
MSYAAISRPLGRYPAVSVSWINTAARNKAMDRLRKEATRFERQHAAQLLNP